jgi:hypothetical protein
MATWPRGEMCKSCAGRVGTDANNSPETVATLTECVATGEPFYCHESTAVRDKNGGWSDSHGKKYRWLPESRWRLCRAWMAARAAREPGCDGCHEC